MKYTETKQQEISINKTIIGETGKKTKINIGQAITDRIVA